MAAGESLFGLNYKESFGAMSEEREIEKNESHNQGGKKNSLRAVSIKGFGFKDPKRTPSGITVLLVWERVFRGNPNCFARN